MDEDTRRFIDDAFDRAMKDTELLTEKDLIRMLSLDPESEECGYLGSKAREIARVKAKNKAQVGTAFGIDYQPCAASCKYCSFGKAWGLIEGEYYVPAEDIEERMRDRIARGYRKFTLRTTEYYDIDRLCDMARHIREHVPGKYCLSVNTGELSAEQCEKLHDAGIDSAFHTLHLREGIDTNFAPEVRIRTMETIRDSSLSFTAGIDPIGIEHTNEEIAERIMFIRAMKPKSMCSMKRINPKGTPVGDLPEVSDRRVAQVAAVIRFATDGGVSAVPMTRIAMEWGANGSSIGTGANPRDDSHDVHKWGEWRSDQDALRYMFRDAGYDIDIPEKAECPICRSRLNSVPKTFDKCAFCGKETDLVAACSEGHMICASCVEPVIRSEIKRVCMSTDSKDPYLILQELLSIPIVFGRFVKYHIALPAALVAAYCNAKGDRTGLSSMLEEAMRRGDYVPPRACGHWGSCGSAVSCGIFYSIVTKTSPLSGESFGALHRLTGGCLTDIGEIGGPRCCNRGTLLSLKRTVEFVRKELGVEMDWEDRRCTNQSWNRECMGAKCPFNPKHTS